MKTTYKRFRVRMYVGPTAVQHYAKRARALGYTDIVEGTEHISFTTGWLPPIDERDPIADLTCRQRDIGEAIHGRPVHRVWQNVEILRAL